MVVRQRWQLRRQGEQLVAPGRHVAFDIVAAVEMGRATYNVKRSHDVTVFGDRTLFGSEYPWSGVFNADIHGIDHFELIVREIDFQAPTDPVVRCSSLGRHRGYRRRRSNDRNDQHDQPSRALYRNVQCILLGNGSYANRVSI